MFAQRLSVEEKRGIAEQLSEEELTIFDLLTKPKMDLTNVEEREVKKVAKQLLDTQARETRPRLEETTDYKSGGSADHRNAAR